MPNVRSAPHAFLWNDSCEEMNKCLFTPDRESMTEQTDITKVQLSKPMHFTGLLIGLRVSGYLEKQKCFTDNSITKAHPNTGDSSQSRKPEAHCTTCSHLDRLESVLSKWLSWSEPLLGSSIYPVQQSVYLYQWASSSGHGSPRRVSVREMEWSGMHFLFVETGSQ